MALTIAGFPLPSALWHRAYGDGNMPASKKTQQSGAEAITGLHQIAGEVAPFTLSPWPENL